MSSQPRPSQQDAVSLAKCREEIPDWLSDELVHILALLDGAEPRAAQALIASLPYGERAALSAHELIDPIIPRRGAVSLINVTAIGWLVIGACAKVYSPTDNQERAWTAALEEAYASYRQRHLGLSGVSVSLPVMVRRLVSWRRGGRSDQL